MASDPVVSPRAVSYHKTMVPPGRSCIDCHQGIAHAAADSTAPISHPGVVGQYQLYPGGKVYEVTDMLAEYGSSLAGVTITPDMLTNLIALPAHSL